MIRHMDLFAGIGGFSLAASWTGVVEPAGFCEIDPWCRQVLAKHWPEVPQHDDITTLTGHTLERFGRIDLITGGFPCQPFSASGKRRGKDDDRYLWPAMAAVIDEARPTYVLAENSPRIRTMVLDDMFDDLERLGYTVRAAVIPAAGVGAIHRRDRMWAFAHLDRARKQQSSGSIDTCRMGAGVTTSDDADIDRVGRGKGGYLVHGQPSRSSTGGQEVLANPRSRRHGAPEETVCTGGDTAEYGIGRPTRPGLLRRVHGVSRRVDRVRGLGNAIVPAVAYEILRVMLAEEMTP